MTTVLEMQPSNGAGSPTRLAHVADFCRELWSRNEDIIDERAQAALQAMHVLIAGCGTVGGSVVEPLCRLGACAFTLADPDAFEINNLNRQACLLTDIGRPKPEVLAERIRAINPFASVFQLPEGLTETNVEAVVGRATAVFEGVDAFSSLWVKYLVHDAAARRRIPVLAGVDFGGKPTIYVFDYRRDPRPFYGRARMRDFKEGRLIQALRWLAYRDIPADFVPVIEDRLRSGRPWPQVSYCAAAMGALGTRALLEVAQGRTVRHVITVDVHGATRTTRRRLVERARWPFTVGRALVRLRRKPEVGEVRTPDGPSSRSAEVGVAVAAIRMAPSVHNTQPWKIRMTGDYRFVLDWDRGRILPATDPDRRGLSYSLGCALEAAATVARLEYQPSPGNDPNAPDWYAGRVAVHGVREACYARAAALLKTRGTHRGPFFSELVEKSVLDGAARLATIHQAQIAVVQERGRMVRVARLSAEGAAETLRQESMLNELLDWIRISPQEGGWDADGFTRETLRVGPVAAHLVGWLKASPTLRNVAARIGLPKAIGSQVGAAVAHSGALVLLFHSDPSPQGCISAGRALMATWLSLTEANLAVQPVNFPLMVNHTRKEVLDLFDVPDHYSSVALLRVGRASAPPPRSPRLPLDRIWVQELPGRG